MTVGASGRGGGAMARLFRALSVLVLGSLVSWAGAEADGAEPTGGSPPVVTLRTLVTGTCQEVQRYAESVVGSGVIRSAAEVRSAVPPARFHRALGLTSVFDLPLTSCRLCLSISSRRPPWIC